MLSSTGKCDTLNWIMYGASSSRYLCDFAAECCIALKPEIFKNNSFVDMKSFSFSDSVFSILYVFLIMRFEGCLKFIHGCNQIYN